MDSKHTQRQAVTAIQLSYALLSQEQDLSPKNQRITDALTNLVHTLTTCLAPDLSRFLLNTPDLAEERENLPRLCGMAECEMEKFWTRKLIDQEECDLRTFWYFSEYAELCEAEVDLFKQRSFSKISFLGAGALPLTAFLLAQHCPDTPVTCVDFDPEACTLAAELAAKIGLQDRVDVRCMDALDYVPEKDELVICASLLQGREKLYRQLQEHDCAAMIVRDSEGPYQYLYKPAELPRDQFREVARTSIDSRRINTSRYFVRQTGLKPPRGPQSYATG